MNLRKIVTKSRDNDFEEMAGAVESMRNVNSLFKSGSLPDSEFSLDDLKVYVNQLVSLQEENGSWTVAAVPESLSEDEKIEFLSYPSFLAVGTLILAKDFISPDDIDRWDRALERGMDFLTLKGYGEDALFQILEMVLMLIEAGAIPWLKKRKENAYAGNLYDELSGFRSQIKKRLDTGDTILSFGGDYRPVFEMVLSGLSQL